MGLLTNLKNFGSTIVKSVVDTIKIPVYLVNKSAPLVAPVAVATGTAVLTKSPTATIGAFAGTSAIQGALFTKPKETIETLVKAPVQFQQFTSNIGEFIAEPSTKKAKEIYQENPLLTIAGGAIVGGLTIKGATGLLATKELIDDDKETREKEVFAKEKLIGENPIIQDIPTKKTDLGTPVTIPERETTTLTDRKRYKRSKKKETPSIRINNAIAINNTTNGLKITNKRYLKEYAY